MIKNLIIWSWSEKLLDMEKIEIELELELQIAEEKEREIERESESFSNGMHTLFVSYNKMLLILQKMKSLSLRKHFGVIYLFN